MLITEKVEEFKHTSNMYDHINDSLDNCNTIKETDDMKESLSNKIKRDSANFLKKFEKTIKNIKID